MSFFDSEVVRAEMAEIAELQEEVYENVFKFPRMSKEDQKYHVSILERLLDKQRVLYTRLSLSDDPAAQKMKKEVEEGARKMGLPSNVDMNILFANMNNMVEMMKNEIDKESTL
tara:strand:- start:69 stop:410 length:342 start_codon:yes stop_codon:yes gene_type:complete